MALTRRRLLRTGAAGVAFLTLADCARRGAPSASATERDAIVKIADAMLDGAVPASGAARSNALDVAADGFFAAVRALPPELQHEVGQLFTLLTFAPLRRIVAGLPPWDEVTRADVDVFLQRWRTSGTSLLRSGYEALHELIMTGWYEGDDAWTAIGYPGPPRIA
jgi:hypothetical protein